MSGYLLSHNQYGKYCVPVSSRHRFAAQQILAHQVYEPRTIKYMTAHCAGGDIVHAGTYFGDFLPALSKACAPGATIWAFEPNTENFRCANITLQMNGIENVTLLSAGLGAEGKWSRLRTIDENGLALGGASQMVSESSEPLAGTEEIQVVALDDALPTDRRVSIIQLDVEGGEDDALRGAIRTIRRCRPIIIVEVSPGSAAHVGEWFTENILSLGYRPGARLHENIVFSCQP